MSFHSNPGIIRNYSVLDLNSNLAAFSYTFKSLNTLFSLHTEKFIIDFFSGILKGAFIRQWYLSNKKHKRKSLIDIKHLKSPVLIGRSKLTYRNKKLIINISYYFDIRGISEINRRQMVFFLQKAETYFTKLWGINVRFHGVNYFLFFFNSFTKKGKYKKFKGSAKKVFLRTKYESKYFDYILEGFSSAKVSDIYSHLIWKFKRNSKNRFFFRALNGIFCSFIFKLPDFSMLTKIISYELSGLRKLHNKYIKFFFNMISYFFQIFKQYHNILGFKMQVKGRIIPFTRENPRSITKVIRTGGLYSSNMKVNTQRYSSHSSSRFGAISCVLTVSKQFTIAYPTIYRSAGFLKLNKRYREGETIIEDIFDLYNENKKKISLFFFYSLIASGKIYPDTNLNLNEKVKILFPSFFFFKLLSIYKSVSLINVVSSKSLGNIFCLIDNLVIQNSALQSVFCVFTYFSTSKEFKFMLNNVKYADHIKHICHIFAQVFFLKSLFILTRNAKSFWFFNFCAKHIFKKLMYNLTINNSESLYALKKTFVQANKQFWVNLFHSKIFINIEIAKKYFSVSNTSIKHARNVTNYKFDQKLLIEIFNLYFNILTRSSEIINFPLDHASGYNIKKGSDQNYFEAFINLKLHLIKPIIILFNLIPISFYKNYRVNNFINSYLENQNVKVKNFKI